jgi:hypothetical protein
MLARERTVPRKASERRSDHESPGRDRTDISLSGRELQQQQSHRAQWRDGWLFDCGSDSETFRDSGTANPGAASNHADAQVQAGDQLHRLIVNARNQLRIHAFDTTSCWREIRLRKLG